MDRSAYNTRNQTIYDEPRDWMITLELDGETMIRRISARSKFSAGDQTQARYPDWLIKKVVLWR